MFVFIKKVFHIGSLFLSSLVSTTLLSCFSINNQVCKVRPEIVNVNSNESVFYSFSIKTSKCSGSCELNLISGFFAFLWLIVWADGINKCGWCLAGGRGC